MSTIPLFTSIPPRMTRVELGGSELGERYQRLCIESWISAGFKVYSINSINEAIPSHVADLIEIITLDRDALKEVGRPLIYVDDMFRAIERIATTGPFVVTNADIFFNGKSEIFDIVAGIERGECLIERRWDVEQLGKTAGAKMYCAGFDLFAFNAGDVSKINCGEFVFGVPWWDHVVPIRSLLSGFARKRAEFPLAYHLKHEERWDRALWTRFGKEFVRTIVPDARVGDKAKAYKGGFEKHVKKKKIYRGMNRQSLKALLQTIGILSESEDDLLHRLHYLNVRSIDRW